MLFIHCYFNISVKLSLYFPFVRYFSFYMTFAPFQILLSFYFDYNYYHPRCLWIGTIKKCFCKGKALDFFSAFLTPTRKSDETEQDLRYSLCNNRDIVSLLRFLPFLWDCGILPLESNLNQITKRNGDTTTPSSGKRNPLSSMTLVQLTKGCITIKAEALSK